MFRQNFCHLQLKEWLQSMIDWLQCCMIHKLHKYGIQRFENSWMSLIKFVYSSSKRCVKINQSTLTDLFSCNKGIGQGDDWCPVLFSLFMNDLPQYFKYLPQYYDDDDDVCRWFASNQPSAEGLQSLDVVHKHAQDWKLKVNTKSQT